MFWVPAGVDPVTVTLYVPAGVVGAPGIAGGGLLTHPAQVTTRSNISRTGAACVRRDCGNQRRSRAYSATVPTQSAAKSAGRAGAGPEDRQGTRATQLVRTVTNTVGGVGPPRVIEVGLTEQIVFGAADVQVRFSTTTRPGEPVMLTMY